MKTGGLVDMASVNKGLACASLVVCNAWSLLVVCPVE